MELVAILVAVLVVLLTLGLTRCVYGRQKRGNRILFVGLNDSGKTKMFLRLVSGKDAKTQTSIKENKGSLAIKLGNKEQIAELVDIPGHERVRSHVLDQYKDGVRGIVLVIDSANIEGRDVAELVYDILADAFFGGNRIPLLLACNKQDMPTAKSQAVIKSLLEKEIDALRVTRSAALEGIDNTKSPDKNAFIGKQGKSFEFSHISCPINFAECACTSDIDMKPIQTWIENLF